jgi:hypothetical protein
MLGDDTVKFWIIGIAAFLALCALNGYMEEKEHAANEAYRVRVAQQKKTAKDKVLYDLAKRGEYMTGFAMVQK